MMNKHQALKRAQELWGDDAMVEYRPKRKDRRTGKELSREYRVGKYENIIIPMFFVRGMSNKSWEDAFIRAENF